MGFSLISKSPLLLIMFLLGYDLGTRQQTDEWAKNTSNNSSPADLVEDNNLLDETILALAGGNYAEGSNRNADCPSAMTGRGVPTFKLRNELGSIMQSEGFTRGAELGVQYGGYSKEILSNWPSCSNYHLVDLWGHQENYKDVANVNQAEQDKIFNAAMESVSQWKDKIITCRNFTTSCVNNYEDGYFDFIYVDARHDYKGVWEDVMAYWPKLKVGGIIAGHDYVTNDDGPLRTGQDWSINYDGTKDETGTVVKGAVDVFAAMVCRQVTVSYRESFWNTWAIRK